MFLLTLSGLVPVMLLPSWPTALIVAGVIVLAALVDFFLVPRVHDLALQRTPGPHVRLGDDTHSGHTLINGSPRVPRLDVRDACTPCPVRRRACSGAHRAEAGPPRSPGRRSGDRTQSQSARAHRATEEHRGARRHPRAAAVRVPP